MTKYDLLYEFNEEGLEAFSRVFSGALDESSLDPTNKLFAVPVAGTNGFEVGSYQSTKEMAEHVLSAIGSLNVNEILPNTGLWAWITFVLRDQLFKRDASGRLKSGEIHRWYPSDPRDYQKGQRHLVRMPVLLLHSLGSDADHLLCGDPSVLPEIREQLTSQQDMFASSFQKVARRLYFDTAAKKLKRGAGGKGAGSPRRLAKVRLQLDVTWDLEDLGTEGIVSRLPAEFERYLV